jgi:hypothetical protein
MTVWQSCSQQLQGVTPPYLATPQYPAHAGDASRAKAKIASAGIPIFALIPLPPYL